MQQSRCRLHLQTCDRQGCAPHSRTRRSSLAHRFQLNSPRGGRSMKNWSCPPAGEWQIFDQTTATWRWFAAIRSGHCCRCDSWHRSATVRRGKSSAQAKLLRMIHGCDHTPATQEGLYGRHHRPHPSAHRRHTGGRAVLLEGRHGCFEIRGVRSDASMITCKFSSEFDRLTELQRRFMDLARACGNGR